MKRRLSSDVLGCAAGMTGPLALGLAGLGLWVLSQGQPVRIGAVIGPGFMAQGLALGIVALAALWGAVSLWCRPAAGAAVVPPERAAQRGAGLTLLGGVLAFALAVPWLGLVVGACLAAGFAAWATGERRTGAIATTMAALAALVAAIGHVLLPPTAPLWPGA